MAKIILRDPRSSPDSRARALSILNDPGSVASAPPAQAVSRPDSTTPHRVGAPPLPPAANYVDPDWEAFMRDQTDSVESADTVASLKKLRAFNAKKLELATRQNDVAGIATYTKQITDLETVISRNLLLAKKLGVDAGELMKRETVERFLEAFAFLLMRGADEAIDHLAKECVGKSFPEEIRPTIENYLLSTRLLRPFRGVVGQASAIGLPAWFVEKLINVAADNIEGAREEITEVHRDLSLIKPEEAALLI
jgi:hypothetical protein